jgi:hypothetical protein
MCAVIKQGILGAFSGKVGGVVGTSWKGIAVMKSLPPSVSNPRTAGQIEQRSRMSAVTAFASSTLADVIKPLNDRFASRMSGYNSFVQRNIDKFEGGTLSKPEDVKISPSGNKAQLIDAIAAEAKITKKDAIIDIYWYSIEGTGKALGTDIPYAVVYNRTTKEALGFVSPEHRNLGDFGTISLPDDKFSAGDVLDVYLAFLRVDGTVVFETAYASTTVADADA